MMHEKHEFSVFIDGLSSLFSSVRKGELCVQSKTLHHRITRVLRLKVGDQVVLFDQQAHAQCKLSAIRSESDIDFEVINQYENEHLLPRITFLLPLLKRDALEAAVYSLVEVGVNAIQLVVTHKSSQQWVAEKDRARLERIMIAAAEQSKNYAIPALRSPIPFAEAVDSIVHQENPCIFFSPEGLSPEQMISNLKTQEFQEIFLVVGPEGDLTNLEKESLQKVNISFCALTPTILRAQQAIAIGAGLIRLFFR